MPVIEKHIGTTPVSINIVRANLSISVFGEVYPFADRSHRVEFGVRCTERDIDASFQSSNARFDLSESIRLLEAGRIACDQASYYEDLARSLAYDKTYEKVMLGLLGGQNSELVIDALLLTPISVSKENVEKVLQCLDKDARHLGVSGNVFEELDIDFYSLPGMAIECVCAICERHPDFKADNNDLVQAIVELISNLRTAGVLSPLVDAKSA